LQEAILVLSMLLQRLELVDFTNYQLETKQTLTIKPSNFHIKVRPRGGHTASAPLTPNCRGFPARGGTDTHCRCPPNDYLLVLYASNLGTADGLAHTIAEDASKCGFVATVGSLDDHVGSLPKEGCVVVVTSSCNGQPPDQLTKFCHRLQDPSLKSVASHRYLEDIWASAT
jgi:cytochrome P450/NADPH-cytochrome P450 reductase